MARAGYAYGRQPLGAPAVARYAGRPAGRASGRAGPARTRPPPGGRGSRPTPRASARRRRRSAPRPSAYAAVELLAAGDDPRLVRGPRAELRAARADGEVGVDGLARAAATAVPSTRTWRSSGCHGNSSAHARVGGELGALAGAGVGEEDEAVVGDALEQHQPGGRDAVGRRRSRPPSRWARGAGGVRLVVPAAEHRDRVRQQVGLGQPAAGVLLAGRGQSGAQVVAHEREPRAWPPESAQLGQVAELSSVPVPHTSSTTSFTWSVSKPPRSCRGPCSRQ